MQTQQGLKLLLRYNDKVNGIKKDFMFLQNSGRNTHKIMS